jgi:hypothetical protein
MSQVNIFSIAIGAIVTIASGILLFLLNQYLLFKTRIIFPPSYNQDRISLHFRKEKDDAMRYAGGLTTIIKVSGWKPARGVELFIDGDFDQFKISPAVPFILNSERNSVSIGVLNVGVYDVGVMNRDAGSQNFISIKGIESTDAVCIQRSLRRRSFEFDPAWANLMFATMMIVSLGLVAVTALFGR